MKYVYVAMGNTDTVEGKGRMKPIGAFWDKELAERVSALEGGCMGQPQKAWVETMPIFASLADRKKYKAGDKKRTALAKLTKADKILLGLDKEEA